MSPEVAAVLFFGEKTRGSHLAHIYDKLGLHARVALVAIVAASRTPVTSALRRGAVDPGFRKR